VKCEGGFCPIALRGFKQLFVHYARVSELGGEKLKRKVVQNLSENRQTRTLSTYHQIKLEGRKEQSPLFAEKLLVSFPTDSPANREPD
jgi:hypothetical protein